MLRVFGSVAKMLGPYEKRTKLESKSTKMLLVGYYETDYILLNSFTNESKFSSNVEVDETKNYYDIVRDSIENIPISEYANNTNENNSALFSVESDLTYEEALSGDEAESRRGAIEEDLLAMRLMTFGAK